LSAFDRAVGSLLDEIVILLLAGHYPEPKFETLKGLLREEAGP
jgi:hypothetical protein